jgi:MFS family permease
MAVSAAFVPDVARADLVAHRRSTTRADGDAGGVRARFGFGSTGVALRIAPRLWLVLLASTLLHVGVIGGFTFLPLRIEDLGGSPTDVALSAGLSALFEVPAMLVMGSLARRVGLRAIFIGATLLYAACMASWMLIEVPIVIVATRALTGLAFSGVVVGVVLTIGAILPADLQATGQSLFQTSAFGVAAILANLLGGLLYETIGPQVFGVGAVLALVAAVIGWIAFPSRRV